MSLGIKEGVISKRWISGRLGKPDYIRFFYALEANMRVI